MTNEALCYIQCELLRLGLNLNESNVIMRKILQKIGLDY